MSKFAANLTMLFTELPFLERFAAAREAGFEAVEFLFPYEWPAAELGRLLREHGLSLALFNMPPGNWGAGERGMAAIPGREAEFRAHLPCVRDYAGPWRSPMCRWGSSSLTTSASCRAECARTLESRKSARSRAG